METRTGRLTLPVQQGIDDATVALIERLGADAVRNSDGTELPGFVNDLAARIYSTYFVGRGDQQWALSHPEHATRVYLSSRRVVAADGSALTIRVADAFLADQIEPDTDVDLARYWQVMDRTERAALHVDAWTVTGVGHDASVVIATPQPGHVYSVNFLARQTWDPTQMYNYLVNGWGSDPSRVKERPYDVRYAETWQHVQEELNAWLSAHPDVDVVRFTTFFYHFTLVYDDQAREQFVDWFGYSASVSVPALEAFEAEYGYALTGEDFVDEGYFNSPFRVPTQHFLDWMDFTSRFVTSRAATLVEQVHAAGKEAMMFLGDNWIGMEPYGPHFPGVGLDAVVGSVSDATTCRMIADIPGVRYREGRFLPYFFPDVFNPDGDPAGEARAAWIAARRAIVRSPLDRIGYGGYLSLALEHPDFLDTVEPGRHGGAAQGQRGHGDRCHHDPRLRRRRPQEWRRPPMPPPRVRARSWPSSMPRRPRPSSH